MDNTTLIALAIAAVAGVMMHIVLTVLLRKFGRNEEPNDDPLLTDEIVCDVTFSKTMKHHSRRRNRRKRGVAEAP